MNRANRPRLSRISGSSYDSRLMSRAGDGSTLTLDFTTGQLDPRLTFTRASNATFINNGGLVEWAAANMMTRSQSQDNNSYWNDFGTSVTRTGSQTDPFGGTGAVKLVYNAISAAVVISRTVSVSQGLPYTLSIWMRADSGTVNNIRLGRAAAASGAFTPTLTTTWQRYSLSFVATTASDGIELRLLFKGTPDTATFHVFGAQLEPGSTMRDYNPALLDVPYHAPRFDYDSDTLAPRGLLIEGAATNYLPFSQGLVGTGWFTGGICTRTQNYATGPDGVANSATRLEMSFSGGEGRTYYASSYTTLPHTNSVWLKSNTGSNQTVRLWNTSGTPVTCTVTPTWQRFQSVSATGTSLPGYFYLENPSSTVAVDILAWGAQLEAGSGASSYIPTGASQVQRLADKMSMLDITTMQWNQTAGTLLLHMDVAAETNTSSFPAMMGMYTATPVRVVRFLLNNSSGTNPRIGCDTWTAAPAQILTSLIARSSAPTAFKYAAALSNTGRALSHVVNNGSVTTATGTGTLQTPTRMLWHQDPSALDTEYFPVHIRTVKYWPTNLPDATLKAITT